MKANREEVLELIRRIEFRADRATWSQRTVEILRAVAEEPEEAEKHTVTKHGCTFAPDTTVFRCPECQSVSIQTTGEETSTVSCECVPCGCRWTQPTPPDVRVDPATVPEEPKAPEVETLREATVRLWNRQIRTSRDSADGLAIVLGEVDAMWKYVREHFASSKPAKAEADRARERIAKMREGCEV